MVNDLLRTAPILQAPSQQRGLGEQGRGEKGEKTEHGLKAGKDKVKGLQRWCLSEAALVGHGSWIHPCNCS